MLSISEAKNYSGIATNSKEIREGDLFVAIPGTKFNGVDFIEEAVDLGAKGVILKEGSEISKLPDVKYYYVRNPRIELSRLAATFFPNQPENIVAVTGTNGKTSTSHLFAYLCSKVGYKSAAVGTNGVVIYEDGKSQTYKSASLTCPDPITLHRYLQELAELNITHVAIEASSHGIEQHRIDNVKLKAAAFTNLTPEHLDYHKTMDNYFAAKAKLFSSVLPNGAHASINATSDYSKQLRDVCESNELSIHNYGGVDSEYSIRNLDNGSLLKIKGESYKLNYKFAAEFQAQNLACALSLLLSIEPELENKLVDILDTMPPQVPGRVELVATYNEANIYLDFAHTPDALELVLKALKKTCKGRLISLFGCGGDRDNSKRSIMGKLSSELADITIITDDNPRTEKPEQIRKEIKAGCSAKNYIEIDNGREEAIRYAISILDTNDVLVISGKGHEEYQIIGTEKFPFSDKDMILKYAK